MYKTIGDLIKALQKFLLPHKFKPITNQSKTFIQLPLQVRR